MNNTKITIRPAHPDGREGEWFRVATIRNGRTELAISGTPRGFEAQEYVELQIWVELTLKHPDGYSYVQSDFADVPQEALEAIETVRDRRGEMAEAFDLAVAIIAHSGLMKNLVHEELGPGR